MSHLQYKFEIKRNLDKKKAHSYDEAIDCFTRALENLDEESSSDKLSRKERTLLQRSSVFYLNRDYSRADTDANSALKLKCSTTGHFIKGVIAERRNLLNNALKHYELCSDWPETTLIPGYTSNRFDTIQRVKRFRDQQKSGYNVKRGFF